MVSGRGRGWVEGLDDEEERGDDEEERGDDVQFAEGAEVLKEMELI